MKVLIVLTSLLYVLNSAWASGCDPYDNRLEEMTSLKVTDLYLKDSHFMAEEESIRLKLDNGLEIDFRFMEGGKLIGKELIQYIMFGYFELENLSSENVLFSYDNSCRGIMQGETGRYTLKLKVNGEDYRFVYPSVRGGLNGYFAHLEEWLPLF